MSRTILIATLFAWPAAAPAQTWSAQQQEVINQVARCNDGWSESIARKDYKLFDRVCPETADAVFWYAGDAPVRYSGANGLWSGSSAANRRASWKDLRPVVVQIGGDTALVYYSVVWTLQPNEGEPRELPSRRLTIFRRRDGRWLMAGGMIAPVN